MTKRLFALLLGLLMLCPLLVACGGDNGGTTSTPATSGGTTSGDTTSGPEGGDITPDSVIHIDYNGSALALR